MSNIRPSGQHFSVDVALAASYGLHEAFIIHHLQHWIRVNRDRGDNLRDGRTWTYQTMQYIADHFPFLNYEQVKYAIENLEKQGVILKNNYNKRKIDKTLWYAFVEEELFVPSLLVKSKNVYERENSLSKGKIPLAIPDTKEPDAIKPPTKPSSKPSKTKPSKCSVGGFFNCLKKIKISDLDKQRLSEKYEEDLVDKVIKYISRPEFKPKGDLDKAIFYYCKNPSHMTESQEEKNLKKQKIEDEKQEKEEERRQISKLLEKYCRIYLVKHRRDVTLVRWSQEYIEFNSGNSPCKIYYKDEKFEKKIEQNLEKHGIAVPGFLGSTDETHSFDI